MSRFGRPHAAFAARRPPKEPRQIRADWFACVAGVAELARAAEGEGDVPAGATARLGFGVALTRLRVTLRDLEPGNFPLPAASARSMATAWLKLARDFVDPAWSPQARTACAGFLAAGCACLDRLLTDLRTEEARATRQILGERDED